MNPVIESNLSSKKKDIYINSESTVFKNIADYYGISFYHRPLSLSTDAATNDDFVIDFLRKHEVTRLFQFLATSLLESTTISEFCMKSAEEFQTFISIDNHQIECVFQR